MCQIQAFLVDKRTDAALGGFSGDLCSHDIATMPFSICIVVLWWIYGGIGSDSRRSHVVWPR